MQITAYSNFKKAVNSTLIPSGGTSIDCVLKAPTSRFKPTFKITRFNLAWNYIKWDNRYYYVDDIVILTNDIAEFTCSVDVLATFKSDIGASRQFVVRSASAHNDLICDRKYPTFNAATVQTVNLTNLQNQISTMGSIVIGVTNDTTNGAVTYYAFSPTDDVYKSILEYLFRGAYLDSSALAISIEMQKELVNPLEYVVSAMWFPIPKSSIATFLDVNVKIGWWETGIQADGIPEHERIIDVGTHVELPRHPQAQTYGRYMNGSPFTRYTLNCWSFGTIPIDPLPYVINNSFRLRVLIDLYTGVADLYITTDLGTIIARQTTQFGIPFQISQITQNLVQGAITTVGSAISAMTAFGAGNVAGGVIGVANGVVSGIENCMPQVRTIGSVGSKVQFAYTPTITAEYYSQTATDNETMGRPLMEQRTISSLSGYMECQSVELKTGAPPQLKEKIIEFMERGFFYE